MKENEKTEVVRTNKELVQKPIEIVAEELKGKLAETINNTLSSGVPAMMVEPILANLLNEVICIKQEQYQNALQSYNDQTASYS